MTTKSEYVAFGVEIYYTGYRKRGLSISFLCWGNCIVLLRNELIRGKTRSEDAKRLIGDLVVVYIFSTGQSTNTQSQRRIKREIN